MWIPRCGFRIQGTGLQSLTLELGVWISIVGGTPNSSGFQKGKFPEFWNSLYWAIRGHGRAFKKRGGGGGGISSGAYNGTKKKTKQAT